MTANLTIRAFRPDDLPAMQNVRRAAFAPVFRSFREIVGEEIYAIGLSESDQEQASLLESLCRDDAAQRMFVAEVEGNIAGFVCYSLTPKTRTGEIGLNAVHPEHGGRGVGAQMYAYVMALMKDAGMELAAVGTGGDPSHAPARRAYEKAGFGPGIPSVYLYKRL